MPCIGAPTFSRGRRWDSRSPAFSIFAFDWRQASERSCALLALALFANRRRAWGSIAIAFVEAVFGEPYSAWHLSRVGLPLIEHSCLCVLSYSSWIQLGAPSGYGRRCLHPGCRTRSSPGLLCQSSRCSCRPIASSPALLLFAWAPWFEFDRPVSGPPDLQSTIETRQLCSQGSLFSILQFAGLCVQAWPRSLDWSDLEVSWAWLRATSGLWARGCRPLCWSLACSWSSGPLIRTWECSAFHACSEGVATLSRSCTSWSFLQGTQIVFWSTLSPCTEYVKYLGHYTRWLVCPKSTDFDWYSWPRSVSCHCCNQFWIFSRSLPSQPDTAFLSS